MSDAPNPSDRAASTPDPSNPGPTEREALVLAAVFGEGSEREAARDFIVWLKEQPGLGFSFLYLLTALDNYPDEPRFEVVYGVRSLELNLDVRLNVPLRGDDARLPSVSDHFHSALWMEREVYDMFGIRFKGHPDLRRILMYPQFQGHPLRKDYPVDKRQPIYGPSE